MVKILSLFCLIAIAAAQPSGGDWVKNFPVNKSELASSGKARYFSLIPGTVSELRGGQTHLVISVLADTEMVDGVETRVVEERETENGQLVEVSRNFFAIHKRTGDVYYFGEDVDMYKGGKVSSHEGAWRSGVNGAKFGLMMPGKARLNYGFYQEMADKVAMDRSRIISTNETVKTPAGTFKNCVKTEETTPLEPRMKEYKRFAAGIGLVQDSDLKLSVRPRIK